MNQIPHGLLAGILGVPFLLVTTWVFYMVHAYTEKAESLMPNSSFVDSNRAAYSQAGFIGKAMRNGFLTLVLAMPGPCAKRGIVNISEAENFPKRFKQMLFVSWGLSSLLLLTLMMHSIYLQYLE